MSYPNPLYFDPLKAMSYPNDVPNWQFFQVKRQGNPEHAFAAVIKLWMHVTFSEDAYIQGVKEIFLSQRTTDIRISRIGKMKKEFSEYKNLIQLMEVAPKVNSPDGFTERVMARVQVLDQGIWSQVRHALLNPVAGSIYPDWHRNYPSPVQGNARFIFLLRAFFTSSWGLC